MLILKRPFKFKGRPIYTQTQLDEMFLSPPDIERLCKMKDPVVYEDGKPSSKVSKPVTIESLKLQLAGSHARATAAENKVADLEAERTQSSAQRKSK